MELASAVMFIPKAGIMLFKSTPSISSMIKHVPDIGIARSKKSPPKSNATHVNGKPQHQEKQVQHGTVRPYGLPFCAASLFAAASTLSIIFPTGAIFFNML